LLPITDLAEQKKALRELQNQWSKIGMTARDKRAALDARLEVVEAAYKEAEATIWRNLILPQKHALPM
jgi:hypothetical protein